MIRAILFARATAASLTGLRASILASQDSPYPFFVFAQHEPVAFLLDGPDLFEKEFKPIKFPANLGVHMRGQFPPIAGAKPRKPLSPILAQRFIACDALREQQSLDAVDVSHAFGDERLALAADSATILFFGRWNSNHSANTTLAAL